MQVLRRIREHVKDYIFVFDIDNTIVSDVGEVDNEFFEIAEAMISRDIRLTFATGRSYECSRKIVERAKTKLPVICFDGQVLCTSKKVLYKHVISEISKTMFEELKKDFYVYFEDTYEIVTYDKKAMLFYSIEFDYPRKRIKIDPNMHLIKPLRIYLRKKNQDIESDEDKIIELVCDKDIKLKTFPKGVWMMLYPKKADKLDACLELCKLQGMDMRKVIFFGDDYNDLKLMRKCGISIAMGDSINKIIATADFKIGSVKEKGISTFLNHILELERIK